MGVKTNHYDICIQRSREQLLTQNLTLHLGYTPPPDQVTAINNSNINQHLLNVPSVLTPYSLPVHHDINIERETSRDNYNTPVMAEDARFIQIETNVDTLRTQVSSHKTDVGSISEKMDILTQAMKKLGPNSPAALDNPTPHSTPPGVVPSAPPTQPQAQVI